MNYIITTLIGIVAIIGTILPRTGTFVWDKVSDTFGAISYPTSLDSLTNPSATDRVSTVSHSGQHSNANDAIEARKFFGKGNKTDEFANLDDSIGKYVLDLLPQKLPKNSSERLLNRVIQTGMKRNDSELIIKIIDRVMKLEEKDKQVISVQDDRARTEELRQIIKRAGYDPTRLINGRPSVN